MLHRVLPTLRAAAWCSVPILAAILPVSACDDRDDPTAPVPTVSTVAGTVINSGTGEPVAGAEVSIGTATVTTGPDGRFELADLAIGPASLRCIAPGYQEFEAAVTITSGRITREIGLTRIELFEFGDFALHIPAGASTVRGILLALGGPDTRGFASGAPFGAPVPEVETSLQVLGQEFRALAARHGLAVMGTSLAAMVNSPDSDQLLLDAIREAAAMSGRPELVSVPLLLYGMSGGGPQASGFTTRNPRRVAGLFLKVPAGVQTLTVGEVLEVPTFMILAELDAFVDNAALFVAFEANRRTGALWALALEAEVPHNSLTPRQRELTTNWMSTVLELRLSATAGGPLRVIAESTGWLGDPDLGAAPWDTYLGDRATSNWFPSQGTAEEWEAFVGVDTAAIGSVLIDPVALTMRVGSVGALTATVLTRSGRQMSAPIVHFTSDDEDVATVGRDQLCLPGCTDFVYVLGVAQGATTITAESGGVTATATVTILSAFGSVKVTPPQATISVGDSVQLTATPLDQNGEEIPICMLRTICPPDTVAIEWLSESQDVATVSDKGVVTGVAKGRTTILVGLPGPFGPDPNTTGTAAITVE